VLPLPPLFGMEQGEMSRSGAEVCYEAVLVMLLSLI
jgi:hypothetical protein